MDRSLINTLVEAIRKADARKTQPYDTQATVTRVEGGTAWVHIPGGVDETPVRLTVDAKKGDAVQVRISGGRAHLTGNATAPPTDDTKANKVGANLTATQKIVKAVKATAEKASRIATSTAQYFWVSTGGTDNGAHITAIPQEQFEADPQNGGGNTLLTTNGVAIRDGLTELATFGANGSQIGTDDYVRVDTNGLTIGANGTEKANLRYGNYPWSDTVRLSSEFALCMDSEKEESADSSEFVKTAVAARTVPDGSTTPGSKAELVCDAQHVSATAGGVESYHAQGDFVAEAGGVSAGIQLEAVCDDVSDPTQNYSVVRIDGDMVRVNRQAAIVKQTYSATGISSNTFYHVHTFNISKSGYTPIAVNVRINQAAIYCSSIDYTNQSAATVSVAHRTNNTISNLNLYLEVTYARSELL